MQAKYNISPIPAPLQSHSSTILNEKLAIKEIKKDWKEDREEEVLRIFRNKIIPPETKNAITRSILIYTEPAKVQAASITVGRAHEIMELYKMTHFIFSHGKCYYLSLVDDFIKEVVRITRPEACRHLFKHLRLPDVSESVKNTRDFYEQFRPKDDTFTDNDFTEHLIACDWDLSNDEASESAISFFMHNSSIMMRGGDFTIRNLLEKNLEKTIKNERIRHKLLKKVCNFVKDQTNSASKDEAFIGAYYLFCIPKPEVVKEESNFVYLSHEYGKPCEHYNEYGNVSDIIEGLQSKRLKKICKGQARILTGPLAKSEGSRVFRLSFHPQKKLQEIKTHFRHLIQKALLADGQL